ncbi:MAG: hypothetical protein ACPGJS_21105 [Flammeovirgaceae bacterium]
MKLVAFNPWNILNKFIFAAFVFLILSNPAIANTDHKAASSKGKGKKGQKAAKALSVDELTLLQNLEKEHEKELEMLKAEELENTRYTKLVVYDLEGNLLHKQDSKNAAIDYKQLPASAKLLITVDELAIYLVM